MFLVSLVLCARKTEKKQPKKKEFIVEEIRKDPQNIVENLKKRQKK